MHPEAPTMTSDLPTEGRCPTDTACAATEPEWVASYRTSGLAVIPGVLPLARLDRIARDMHCVYARQLERLGLPVTDWSGRTSLRRNMERLLQADVKAYLAATRHTARLASLQQLVVSDAVLSIASALGLQAVSLPTSPVLHVMGDTLRIAGGYHGVATHQDWPVVRGSLDAVTMWFSLFEVTPRTYPLQLIPGSHRRGVWPSQITEHTSEVDPSTYVDADFISATVARGDLLVFTGFTVHRTAVKDCAGLRIAASMRYENTVESTFVERGYPCAYQRTVIREAPSPGFPSARQVDSALGLAD
jgi:phytanoyl-CoA hydroxylase